MKLPVLTLVAAVAAPLALAAEKPGTAHAAAGSAVAPVHAAAASSAAAVHAASASAAAVARAASAPPLLDPHRLPRGAPDPIEHLRRRLAEKLAASRATTTPNPRVLQVAARSDRPEVHAVAARSGAQAPAAKHAAAPAAQTTAPPAAQASGAPTARALAPAHAPGGVPAPAHEVHWDYEGPGGPAHWGRLKPEYATCERGTRQSPIDFRDPIRVDLEPIRFDYKPGGFRVVDNGHTIQVEPEPGNTIEARGRRFELVQFHFHRPSEETIDGRRFDMSLHLVHRDLAGKLAVVAVLFDAGAAHPALQQVWNHLPLERSEQMVARRPLDPAALLPDLRGYFATMGSLTTPPCDEGVLWLVMQQPVAVSPEQIAIFSRLYPMNARPTQSGGGRLIQASN